MMKGISKIFPSDWFCLRGKKRNYVMLERNKEKFGECGMGVTPANKMNPRSRERSLDEIDDMENLNFLMVDLRYNFVSCHLMPSMRTSNVLMSMKKIVPGRYYLLHIR